MNEMNEETTCDIRVGHAIELLRDIPDGTIDLVVTSPPYWGLRDYKTDPVVFGGDTECEHEWHDNMSWQRRSNDDGKSEKQASNKGANDRDEPIEFTTCRVCDAWKGQLGLEQTPEEFIDHLVEIFSECHRVLKPTGNLWVNLGDSYMRKGSYTPPENYGLQKHRDEANQFRPTTIPPGYKEKDLVGIPWAFCGPSQSVGHTTGVGSVCPSLCVTDAHGATSSSSTSPRSPDTTTTLRRRSNRWPTRMMRRASHAT
jgi:hypothetical protein